MNRKEELFVTPQERQKKKLRFRGDLAAQYGFTRDSLSSGLNGTSGSNRIDEVSSEDDTRRQDNNDSNDGKQRPCWHEDSCPIQRFNDHGFAFPSLQIYPEEVACTISCVSN